MGFAAGKIPRLPLNLTLLKSASAVGVFWGDFAERFPEHNRANLSQLRAWFEQGLVRPYVDRVYPFEEASAGFACLADRRVLDRVYLVP